jgi:hypothetical protein
MSTDETPIRYRLIKQPRVLPEADIAKLTNEFIELSQLTTSYGDSTYLPARTGWTKYFHHEGARPHEYDRLSLAYRAERLISCAALKKQKLEGDSELIWLQLTITLPEYHGTGVAATTIMKMFDEEFLEGLNRGYVLVRTPNPIVFEMVRRFLPIFRQKGVAGTLYPVITPSGTLEPISRPEKEELCRLVARVSPGIPFDIDTFVIRGYYGQFGALYKAYDFYCKNKAVKDYFTTHLRCARQEGIVIVVKFHVEKTTGLLPPPPVLCHGASKTP